MDYFTGNRKHILHPALMDHQKFVIGIPDMCEGMAGGGVPFASIQFDSKSGSLIIKKRYFCFFFLLCQALRLSIIYFLFGSLCTFQDYVFVLLRYIFDHSKHLIFTRIWHIIKRSKTSICDHEPCSSNFWSIQDLLNCFPTCPDIIIPK